MGSAGRGWWPAWSPGRLAPPAPHAATRNYSAETLNIEALLSLGNQSTQVEESNERKKQSLTHRPPWECASGEARRCLPAVGLRRRAKGSPSPAVVRVGLRRTLSAGRGLRNRRGSRKTLPAVALRRCPPPGTFQRVQLLGSPPLARPFLRKPPLKSSSAFFLSKNFPPQKIPPPWKNSGPVGGGNFCMDTVVRRKFRVLIG